MNLKQALAFAALSIASMSCHAGVMYEWVPVNAVAPQDISFKIVFDHGTVARGSYKYVFTQPYANYFQPVSEVVSMNYLFPGNPRGIQYTAAHGFRDTGYFYMDVDFTSEWFLTGTIRINNSESHIFTSSQGKLFTVTNASSDDPAFGSTGCVPMRQCSGATGHFRRVPEPSTAALLGLGLASALVARRRKRRSASAA